MLSGAYVEHWDYDTLPLGALSLVDGQAIDKLKVNWPPLMARAMPAPIAW